MKSRKRRIYILGSTIIGMVAILLVYILLMASGVIQLKKIQIVFTSDSAEKIYDGMSLSCKDYTISSGELADGHKEKLIFSGKQTLVGSTKNTFSVVILDTQGTDVSEKYDIKKQEGNLTVIKRTIEIKIANVKKDYDGEALKTDEWSLASGTLLTGHKLTVDVKGELTEVGEKKNIFTASIKDAFGNDVTYLYDITDSDGILEVVGREIRLTFANASKMYDGTPLTCDEWTLTSGTLIDNDEIRVESIASLTEVGEIDNQFSIKVISGSGEDVTKNYNILYEVPTLKVEKKALYIRVASATKNYDGQALSPSNYSISGSLVEGHNLDVELTGEIINVGSKQIATIIKIFDEENNDVTKNYEITVDEGTLTVNPQPLFLTFQNCEKTYDGTPLSYNKGFSISSGKLINNHSLDVEVKTTITQVGDVLINPTISIYDEENNDVSLNYNAEFNEAKLKITKAQITITSGSARQTYDGQPLSNDYCEITSGTVYENDHLEIEMTKEIINAGSVDNDFTVTIRNDMGEDVTNNYNIIKNCGKLEIKPISLSIKLESLEKEYDGNPLYCEDWDLIYGETLEGHELIVNTQSDGIINVGKLEVLGSAMVKFNDEDISQNYQIEIEKSTLTINPRKVYIRSGSAEKEYDGTPLICDEWYIVDGSVLPYHAVYAVISGMITEPGSTDNSISCYIMDKRDASMQINVSDNYDINNLPGRLLVTKQDQALEELYLSPKNVYAKYDGNPHGPTEITGFSELAKLGYTYRVEFTGSQRDVGRSKSKISNIVILDNEENDITKRYKIELIEGEIQVYDTEISITTNSGNKEYDGTELTAPGYVMIGELAANHVIEVRCTGSRTNVGMAINTFTAVIRDTSTNEIVTDNYRIVRNYGILVVSARDLFIQTDDAQKSYDGSPLICHEYQAEGLLEGQSLEIVWSGSQTNVGVSPNEIESVIVRDEQGNDVTTNYYIAITTGNLTVVQ